MRLIDADELSTKILNVSYFDNSDEDIIWSIVQNSPTIKPESLRPQNQWIRVKDSLPEPETRVLALTENKHIITAMYEDGTIWRDASCWNFYDLYGFKYDEEQGDYLVPERWWEYALYCNGNHPVEDKVTHWMPLTLLLAEV